MKSVDVNKHCVLLKIELVVYAFFSVVRSEVQK